MPHSNPMRAAIALAGVAVLAALAGCAGPQQPGEPSAIVESADCLAPGQRHFADFGIPEPEGDHAPAPEAGAVPEDFAAVQAVLCTGEFGAEIDGEPWHAVRETRYGGDLSRLREALAQPSDPRGDGPCTADYEIVPELWLVSEEGEAVRAAWPTDRCGKTKPGVREALAALAVLDEQVLPVAKADVGDPFASCLSKLPPGELGEGLVIEASPVPVDELPAVPAEEPTADPGFAADEVC